MKSSAEILEHLRGVISGILERPQMYVGDLHFLSTTNGVDALLGQHVRLWCWIQNRESDFYSSLAEVGKRHGTRDTQSLLGAYRERNPQAAEGAVVDAIVGYWKELAVELNLDIRWPPAVLGDDESPMPGPE